MISISAFHLTHPALWAFLFSLFEPTSYFLNTSQFASVFPTEVFSMFSWISVCFWIVLYFTLISNALLLVVLRYFCFWEASHGFFFAFFRQFSDPLIPSIPFLFNSFLYSSVYSSWISMCWRILWKKVLWTSLRCPDSFVIVFLYFYI